MHACVFEMAPVGEISTAFGEKPRNIYGRIQCHLSTFCVSLLLMCYLRLAWSSSGSLGIGINQYVVLRCTYNFLQNATFTVDYTNGKCLPLPQVSNVTTLGIKLRWDREKELARSTRSPEK